MSNLIAKAKTTTTPKLYLEFFKDYYKEKTKALVIITSVIGVIAILVGLYGGASNRNIFASAVPIAAGAMLVIYPRFIYRRPYNSVKNNKITTRFEFFDDKMIEYGESSKEEYKYSDLMKVRETGDYFYIYHTRENASVVDKSAVTGASVDELRELLRKNVRFQTK